MEFNVIKNRYQQFKPRDLANWLIFGLITNIFSLVQLRIHNYENAFTDLREVPLLISIFCIHNPISIFVICIIGFLSFLPNDSAIYLPSVIFHLPPIITMWVIYNWIIKQGWKAWTYGVTWFLLTGFYYLALLFPLLILVYDAFGLNNEFPFFVNYIDIVISTKFEIVATSLVASIYLVQLVIQRNLESKKLEIEKLNMGLKQTTKDLDNFIYTASHELKIPIANIEGSVRLLFSDKIKDKEETDLFNMIIASISQFKETEENLTEITKVQRLRENDIKRNEIKEIVNHKINKNNIDNYKEGVKIQVNSTKVPYIQFSENQLIFILENLIDNAIKFKTPNQPLEITINTNENSEFYILCIKDNGVGIKEGYQDKIFSMFRKAHAVSGKGLGLYFVKRIIENEGGKIQVESKEGKGSEFKLFFKK